MSWNATHVTAPFGYLCQPMPRAPARVPSHKSFLWPSERASRKDHGRPKAEPAAGAHLGGGVSGAPIGTLHNEARKTPKRKEEKRKKNKALLNPPSPHRGRRPRDPPHRHQVRRTCPGADPGPRRGAGQRHQFMSATYHRRSQQCIVWQADVLGRACVRAGTRAPARVHLPHCLLASSLPPHMHPLPRRSIRHKRTR